MKQVPWELSKRRMLLCMAYGVGGKGGHDQGRREIWDVIMVEKAFAR